VTRQRLVDAAADVFVEHGFRGATVRDICARAGANVAAVNYHFGDKETLYRAVLDQLFASALERHPVNLGPAPELTPEQRLNVFVRGLLGRLLSDDVAARIGKIMAREMMEPSVALDHIVANVTRPMFGALTQIVRDLLGTAATDELVARCAFSVVGQCLFYRHCDAAVQRLAPACAGTPASIDALAEHVARFSLAGIAATASANTPSAGPARPSRKRSS
jgi:AcrR family transcriptional regulator